MGDFVMPRRIERGMREHLDNWRIWMGVAYFGLVFIVVWTIFLNRDIAREQAARAATQKAGAVASRDNCYRMVDNNPDLLAIIDSIALTATNSIITNKAAIAVDPHGPLADVRRASIRRNRRARGAALKFKAQIVKSTPTVKRCDQLTRRLGLEPRQLDN